MTADELRREIALQLLQNRGDRVAQLRAELAALDALEITDAAAAPETTARPRAKRSR